MNREKQIEEMASIIHSKVNGANFDDVSDTVVALYSAGYRKQTEGEWIQQEKILGKVIPEAVCSICGRDVTYQVIDNKWAFENYCSHCGAKMKGGAV